MDETEKPFAVDRAKTGRAGCKKCKQKIESGALRIARVQPNPFGGDGSTMKAWHHVACIFAALAKARATTKKIEDPEEDIEGWDAISTEDRREILSHLSDLPPPKPDKKTPMPKSPVSSKSLLKSPVSAKSLLQSPAKSPLKLAAASTSSSSSQSNGEKGFLLCVTQ